MKLPKREHAQKQPIEDLLRDLSIVLNAHQDIDDALREIQWSPTSEKIKEANDRIGEAVMRHLPG